MHFSSLPSKSIVTPPTLSVGFGQLSKADKSLSRPEITDLIDTYEKGLEENQRLEKRDRKSEKQMDLVLKGFWVAIALAAIPPHIIGVALIPPLIGLYSLLHVVHVLRGRKSWQGPFLHQQVEQRLQDLRQRQQELKA